MVRTARQTSTACRVAATANTTALLLSSLSPSKGHRRRHPRLYEAFRRTVILSGIGHLSVRRIRRGQGRCLRSNVAPTAGRSRLSWGPRIHHRCSTTVQPSPTTVDANRLLVAAPNCWRRRSSPGAAYLYGGAALLGPCSSSLCGRVGRRISALLEPLWRFGGGLGGQLVVGAPG